MYRFLLYRSHLHVKIFFIKTVTYLYQDKLIHSLQHAMNDL